MKKLLLLIPWFLALFLAWCFNQNVEVIDDCIFPEDCTDNKATDDLQDTYLTAYGTEPFRDIEISWWIAKLSSPMFETEYEESVIIRNEWENYYFSWEELEWEFILKDCIDGWKWDMHYYTVWVAKIRDYYYEWCGDWIEWIKMSDEDVSEDWYQDYWDNGNCKPDFYPIDHEIFQYADIMEEKVKNWFCDVESCMHTLNQYQPERMPWDPQTQITVWCWPMYYWSAYITWFIYTSVYPDLWLRITSPKWYDTFYVKSETPIFVRNWDKISHGQEYIRVYEKSANESLFEMIESNLNKGCFAQPREYEWQNKIYWNINNNMIYEVVDKDWNIWWDCIADNESKEQDYTLVRYFESLDRTKYYKLVFTDGCAPGPCSMFGEVEVF